MTHEAAALGAFSFVPTIEHGPVSLQVFFPVDNDEISHDNEDVDPFFTTDFFTVNPGRTVCSRLVRDVGPFAFIPTTDTVYRVPLTKPAILHEVITVSVDEHVLPPGVAVAVYVIPTPSPSACTHATSSAFFCGVASNPVTAPGGPAGITDTPEDAVPTPTLFVAVTEME